MNFVAVDIVLAICFWPLVQQKSSNLISLNRILLCFDNSSFAVYHSFCN